MQDALTWIRNNDPEVEADPDESILNALSKITGAPIPKKMKPKHKKRFVDDSISWLRSNDPGRLDTVDDPTATAFTKLAGIPYEGRPLSADEKKGKAMQDALTWIRNNDPEVEADPDESILNALSKITGAPIPKKMKPKHKKRFVDDSISWLRSN